MENIDIKFSKNILKEMMKIGRELIQEELRIIDKLIKEYRDKEVFKVKDFQTTAIKTKLREIPIERRKYKMVIDGDGTEYTGTAKILDNITRNCIRKNI